MSQARLAQRIKDYSQAVLRLEEACQQPFSSYLRDAVIQRFEFCWELAWNMLKLQLAELGVAVLNPRDTFREALKVGLIHDGIVWTEMQRMRNLTSHTYDETLAQQVYETIVKKGLAKLKGLAQDAAAWSDV